MIWGRTTTTNIDRLDKLQKRAARIILNADFMAPSEIMFKEFNWLSFPNRVTFHICIMMCKTFNNLAPTYLTELFTPTSNMTEAFALLKTRHLESLLRERNIIKLFYR